MKKHKKNTMELNIEPPTPSPSPSIAAASIKSAKAETSNIERKIASVSVDDAQRVDIRDGETALILSVAPPRCVVSDDDELSSERALSAAACPVRVVVASSKLPSLRARTLQSSPQKLKSGRGEVNNIAVGNVQISPSTLYQYFLRSSSDDANNNAITEKISESVKQQNSNTPKSAQSASYASSSPSKSKFSFAKGGGGDQLTSPPTTKSTNPTSKKQQTGVKVLLIPIAFLTRQQRRIICPDAKEITLCRESEDVSNDDDNNDNSCKHVITTLIRSKYKGCYVSAPSVSTQHGDLESKSPKQKSLETISISFKGQMMSYNILEATPSTPHIKEESSNEVNEEQLLQEFNDLNITSEEDSNDATTAKCFLSLKNFIRQRMRAKKTAIAYRITAKTQINFVSSMEQIDTTKCNLKGVETTVPDQRFCAGLDDILTKISEALLPPLTHPNLFPVNGPLRPPKGVLLFGPPGVGKSCLAAQVAYNFSRISGVFVQRINCADILSDTSIVGEAEKTLVEVFKVAENQALHNGSLLVLDDVHLICPRRGETKGSDQIAGTLLALLDGINPNQSTKTPKPKQGGLVILAITTDPSSLDPALRRPGRLDVEVEVPVPDEVAKQKILEHYFSQFQSETIVDVSTKDIATLARLAKGFTGADCKLAVKEAVRNISTRSIRDAASGGTATIKYTDLDHAIRVTKPSAIKSVAVEIPHVSWTDIGGMDHVKLILKESIELPLTHPHLFEMMRVAPPRGILLYGPPGCSKTLMARAIATSGNMNFLAVKGPELLSKWLGESERALASLFRRARLASPSVIFFDEIDAIAEKRGSGGGSGGDRLLSQLLTELDGVSSGGHSSRAVIVGATNRPDILDPALTRPGRMDRKIYVGLPDVNGRESIFRIGLKGKRCDEHVDVSTLASNSISHGYTGAEIIAICRDAALLAIGEIDDGKMELPQIKMHHLLESMKNLKPRTTSEMLNFYDNYGRM